MAEKKKAEKVETLKAEKKDLVDDFIARKLKAINSMENERLAQFLANRVFNNKRGKK